VEREAKISAVSFSDEAIQELLGIRSNVPMARVVPHTLLSPYMTEIKRARWKRSQFFRPLIMELKHRLRLICLACGSEAAAARFLGTTDRQVMRWMSGEAYPAVRRWPVIDHVYAMALDAIRKMYLVGSIRVKRYPNGSRRTQKKTQAWSKRITSNQNKNMSPVLWENYETDTYTRDSGGRTEINVTPEPISNSKT
jgi:hypothetical protein